MSNVIPIMDSYKMLLEEEPLAADAMVRLLLVDRNDCVARIIFLIATRQIVNEKYPRSELRTFDVEPWLEHFKSDGPDAIRLMSTDQIEDLINDPEALQMAFDAVSDWFRSYT